MRSTSTQLLVWAPRLLGLAICLFLALFALDAFEEPQNLARSLADFAIHLLPVLMLVTIVLLSWRRPWIGAFGFITLAVLYTTAFARGRVDWIAVIAGPLFVVGLLFLWSWRQTGDASMR